MIFTLVKQILLSGCLDGRGFAWPREQEGAFCSREAAVAWPREREGAFCSREGLFKAVSAVTETEGRAGKRKDMNSDLADRLADRAEGGF